MEQPQRVMKFLTVLAAPLTLLTNGLLIAAHLELSGCLPSACLPSACLPDSHSPLPWVVCPVLDSNVVKCPFIRRPVQGALF